ncbi:MAG TPA: glycoside hydrolase family 2 TIM barrel-domain containing protein [Terracidiphilus sp.]|nr:glycoside hydrolase family 2 TIM barrel-domain containing protein [Terracidiphilus sp.]
MMLDWICRVASLKCIDRRGSAGAVIGVLLVSIGTLLPAQETQNTIVLTGADRRPAISLNGEWNSIADPYFSGLFSFHHQMKKNGWFLNYKAKPGDPFPTEYNFAAAPKLHVPGDWNTQRKGLLLYEGPMWYERDFTYTPKEHTHLFLHIGAANYQSYFWVNGQKVCEHEGGFTAFNCDITSVAHADGNFIVAAVDNTRHEDNVPTLQTDWWNYGGLTREVSLIEVPEKFIDQYDVHLARGEGSTIAGWVHVADTGAGEKVEVSIPELHAETSAMTNPDGRATFHVEVQGLERWSPQIPKLYQVDLRAGGDAVHELMGFRTIEVHGTEILLNGKPIFLRGVTAHAEAPYRTGRAYSVKDAETLLGWAKELGCNFMRLAHYPHDETMLRAADRMGVLIWSEIPVYWAVEFDNPVVYRKAQQQLDEEINTSRNHASIILWSMANETPSNPTRTEFITKLAEHARNLDSTRLITAALLVRAEGHTKIIDDPLGKALDVIGFNEYIGWYEGRPDTADITQWRIAYQKPLIVSEFGGAAKAGLHGKSDERWTEEYQASIYKHQLPMLNKIANLRGMSPWVLMDFRSPNRPLTGIQNEFNRKGLISEQGARKKAFFVLQEAYRNKTIGKAE